MSADNFVGVRPNKDGGYLVYKHGCMSLYNEDCMYLADEKGAIVSSRPTALVMAHDLVKEMDICEYGVVEMMPVRSKPCGACWVCVYERKIPNEDLPKCTRCNKPIASTEFMSMTSEGQFHRSCEVEMAVSDV